MNKPVIPSVEEAKTQMRTVLELQRQAQMVKGAPDARLRKDRLTRCIDLLLTHKDEFVQALDADFGARSRDLSLFTEAGAR